MRRFILAAALSLAVVNVDAATVAGVKIADSASVANQNLVLNGAGLRKKLMFKVYTGALYLQGKQSNAASIMAADAPRRMVMHFLMDVDKGKIAEAWTDGLKDNTPNASPEVKTAFKTLSSWMEDMKEGQEITMTYVPGTGTTVEVAGKNKGTLGGKAVADAILNTWIGPKPGPGADFKKSVLGM
jgi:Chalcone isomerase-like